MPNQYTKLTRENIIRKYTRKRNPVRSMTELANEFGMTTEYVRHTGTRAGQYDTRAPESFTNKVKTLIGLENFNKIRRSEHVNKMYR